jgi:hypothetical protein
MIHKLFFGLSLNILLFSCDSKPKEQTGIFLGGQITNPSSRSVTLYQGNQNIETLELDDQLRFQKRFDSLGSGIYKLEHLPEYQTTLLEKGDSLWVRINAVAFDESIFYSGNGASKNNFLMELVLKQESENRFLSNKFSKTSEVFNRILDSLLLEKKQLWIQMDSVIKLSPIAQKVTQAAYIYHYANIRERYALLRGMQWDEEENDFFFRYREFLNYSDNDLAFFDPYINYILNFISNEALKHNQSYFQEKKTSDFSIRRLTELDQKISGDLLRNNLARAIAFEEILTFENHDQHDLFLQYYATVNSSNAYLSEVLTLRSDINGMGPKKQLPEIKLQNVTRDIVSSNSLTNGKTTIIYFWSQTQMNHYKNTLERVRMFQKEYPQLRFVGICIQPFNLMVKQVQKMMGINIENQFAIIDFEKASKAWVLTLLNKSIIINNKGQIIDGFENFSNNNIEMLLKELK